jgi:hypothetical protein
LAADFAADPGRRDALDAVVDRFQEGVEGDALFLEVIFWGNLVERRRTISDVG